MKIYCLFVIFFIRNLRELNVEGNQLPAMPSGALNLQNLIKLNVRNNLMHPLFWKENSKNEPQRLMELAATAIDRWSLYSRYEFNEEIERILERLTFFFSSLFFSRYLKIDFLIVNRFIIFSFVFFYSVKITAVNLANVVVKQCLDLVLE